MNNSTRTDSETDRRIASLLKDGLPEANENQWFTRRVINRLPPQGFISHITAWQWACYILSAVALVLAFVFGWRYVTTSYISITMLTVLFSVPLVTLFCAGVLLIPRLVRIVREP